MEERTREKNWGENRTERGRERNIELKKKTSEGKNSKERKKLEKRKKTHLHAGKSSGITVTPSSPNARYPT